jgi:hypothetical protein
MNRLRELQWRVVGYELRQDGTQDLSRPIYNTSNPNAIIEEITKE